MVKEKIKFHNPDQSEFFTTLKERVQNYFSDKGITHYANGFMIFKIIFFLAGVIGSYLFLISGTYPLPIMYITWIVLGLFTAFAGVNIGHDACHGAISKHRWVNTLFGYSFNLIGANAYMWKIKHNMLHHTYTNIEGYDEDIDSVKLVRLSPNQKLYKFQRYQHYYAFFMYALATLSWVFVKDYRKFHQKRIGKYENDNIPTSEFFIMYFSKLVYYILILVIPMIMIHYAWWHILLGFVLMHAFEGFAVAIIIQMSHMVEGVEFPQPKNGVIQNSWAVHQLKTTVDYAKNNWLVVFLFGGLNLHVEHHLFQNICHVHHRPISRIVEQTAREFNVPYQSIETFSGACSSHYKYLKKMGRS